MDAQKTSVALMSYGVGLVGLVAITPGAGFVAIPQSIFIGAFSAVVSNIAVYYKSKSNLDDTLDVFPCHGIGGMVGMLLTGVFATTTVNSAGADGLLYGGFGFFLTQIKGLVAAATYSTVVSYLIFKFINYVLPMRVTSEEEEIGLDATQHNENYMQGTLLVTQPNGKLKEVPAEEF